MSGDPCPVCGHPDAQHRVAANGESVCLECVDGFRRLCQPARGSVSCLVVSLIGPATITEVP